MLIKDLATRNGIQSSDNRMGKGRELKMSMMCVKGRRKVEEVAEIIY